MTRNRVLLKASSLLLILLVCTPSFAQGEKIYTPPEFFKQLNNLVDKQVKLDAKYYEMWGEDKLKHFKIVSFKELKFYLPPKGKLRERLNRNTDINGIKIFGKKSNVEISVRIYKPRPGERTPYLFLTSVVKTADDIDRFRLQLDTVIEKDPNDIIGRFKVAISARKWARKYQIEALTQWSLTQDLSTLQQREKTLKKDDSQGWIQLAEFHLSKLKNKNRAIQIFGAVYDSNKDPKIKIALTKKLEALDAYFYNGRWIPFHDFKAAEGFIERKSKDQSRWITKERAEFDDSITADKKRSFPFLVKADSVYVGDASVGRISKGMRPFQVVKLFIDKNEIGFPQQIDRSRLAVGSNVRVYAQWVYDNGLRFYFVDGHLFAWNTKKTPYPTK
jgi:hypothetical protein